MKSLQTAGLANQPRKICAPRKLPQSVLWCFDHGCTGRASSFVTRDRFTGRGFFLRGARGQPVGLFLATPAPMVGANPKFQANNGINRHQLGFNYASRIPTYSSCPNGNPHAANQIRPRLSCARCWPRLSAIPRTPSRRCRKRRSCRQRPTRIAASAGLPSAGQGSPSPCSRELNQGNVAAVVEIAPEESP